MKRKLLFSVLVLITCFTLNAQIYTPSGTIQGSSGSNNVGIGTNSPAFPLHISKSNSNTNEILLKLSHRGTVNVGNAILIGNDSYDMGSKIIGYNNPSSSNDTRLEFQTSSSLGNYVSVMNLLSNGNVGIGTTNPFTTLMLANVVNGINTARIGFYGQTGNGNNSDNGGVRFINDNASYYSEVAGFRGGDSGQAGLHFYTAYYSTPAIQMTILPNGNVLIGKTTQTNSTYKLDVLGKIRANEVVVNTTGADFVFTPEYKILSLPEVEKFINENKHLPDLQSASEMEENGMNVSEMQMKLLQKLEEMTLYIIEQNKTNEMQSKEIELMKQEIEILKEKK
jgi:hypothetical protein